MIYISAQPDDIYFLWQLEIQICNFRELGIKKENIHILIGYDSRKGIAAPFKYFAKKYEGQASIFCYPDTRKRSKYLSSLRPNLLKQHFRKITSLRDKVIFYHDSDMLLSRVPSLDSELEDDVCYVSNTNSYTGMSYILQNSSTVLLDRMLDTVGLKKEVYLSLNMESGGAQHILKNISGEFWNKVENDCESLFILLQDYNFDNWNSTYEEKRIARSEYKGINPWFADMWSLQWNLWARNIKVKIHSELDFSWVVNSIDDWQKFAILHYTGDLPEDTYRYFNKSLYARNLPYFDSKLLTIPKDSCSSVVVDYILKVKKLKERDRIKSTNACVVVYSETPRLESIKVVYDTIYRYIKKHIDVPVFFYSVGDNKSSYRNRYIRKKILRLTPAKLLWIPVDCLIDHIAIGTLITKKYYCNQVINVRKIWNIDHVFFNLFSATLDIKFLTRNIGKFSLSNLSFRNPIIVQNYYKRRSMKPNIGSVSMKRVKVGYLNVGYCFF